MDPARQNNTHLSSPESATTSSTLLSIPASSYLTVPTTRPPRRLSRSITRTEDDLELDIHPSPEPTSGEPVPNISQPLEVDTQPLLPLSANPYTRRRSRSPAGAKYMSVYSTSSADTEYSTYSNPPAKPYQLPSFSNMSSRRVSPVRSYLSFSRSS
jgi:hypothetical protein